jgi:hypothetical protein
VSLGSMNNIGVIGAAGTASFVWSRQWTVAALRSASSRACSARWRIATVYVAWKQSSGVGAEERASRCGDCRYVRIRRPAARWWAVGSWRRAGKR